MAPTALDPLGNLPEKNRVREEEGKHVCSMCTAQRSSTVSLTCIECICVCVCVHVSVQCSNVDALWPDLKKPILVQMLDRMWKELKKHMTAAVGLSFLVHAFMETLWIYILNEWLYSLMNMCKFLYTVVSQCNQWLNGWLEKNLIDPLSAALALRSVILCSQTAQQSVTETFERREMGIYGY